MDRLLKFNVLATSGRAVEAAGDVDTLLLDKTGTITFGNRMATEVIPVARRAARSRPARRRHGLAWPTRRPRAARSSNWAATGRDRRRSARRRRRPSRSPPRPASRASTRAASPGARARSTRCCKSLDLDAGRRAGRVHAPPSTASPARAARRWRWPRTASWSASSTSRTWSSPASRSASPTCAAWACAP